MAISKIKIGSTEHELQTTIANVTNLQSSLDAKTSTTVVPNNSGEIKTKYRIAQKGYTSGATWYYKICDLPTNNDGNYASAIISGRIGGWVSGNMSYVNALVWNRGTPGIAFIDIAGDATATSSIWNIADLVLYTNGTSATAANTATLYVMCKNHFTFDLDLELFQSTGSITYDGTYITTTPSGTLAAQSSTTTKRVEVINGNMYVNGTQLAFSTHTHSAATTSAAGFMSASDKSKLDGITASADSVAFSRSLTSGTKVGTITINGTGTDLYAPTNTDTHYASGTVVGSSASTTSNTTSALTNGNVYLNHVENGAVKNSHKISGSGATTVTSDASGNIVVSSTNTDTKVTNTLATTTKAYVTGTTSGSTNTGTQVFDTGVYLTTTAGELAATKFTGALNGNATTATTATKLGSSTIGSSTAPVYLNSGTATKCSTYAGGTAVTLNGSSKAASTAAFYAPTTAGTSGQVLTSTGGAPGWSPAFTYYICRYSETRS